MLNKARKYSNSPSYKVLKEVAAQGDELVGSFRAAVTYIYEMDESPQLRDELAFELQKSEDLNRIEALNHIAEEDILEAFNFGDYDPEKRQLELDALLENSGRDEIIDAQVMQFENNLAIDLNKFSDHIDTTPAAKFNQWKEKTVSTLGKVAIIAGGVTAANIATEQLQRIF